MKYPNDIYLVSHVAMIDEAVASMCEVACSGESLAVVLLNYDGYEISHFHEVVATLVSSGSFTSIPKKLDIGLKNRDNPMAKQSIEEPPKVELKVLPSHLRYVFVWD